MIQKQQKWGPLAAPVDPLDTTNIYKKMSAMTKDGYVPTFEEAKLAYETDLEVANDERR